LFSFFIDSISPPPVFFDDSRYFSPIDDKSPLSLFFPYIPSAPGLPPIRRRDFRMLRFVNFELSYANNVSVSPPPLSTTLPRFTSQH